MLHHASLNKTEEMRGILESVARSLVTVETENGLGLIALPQLYPGGEAVVVRIRKEADQFFVDDLGKGYQAAEMLGGGIVFSRLAPKIAKMHGVAFDGVMMFGAQVTLEWLPNVVLFVGSASRRCVEQTAERMSEDVERTLRSDLQHKVEAAYPGRVTRDVEIAGHSSRSRQFAAIAELGARRVVFDLVTPHHVSINGAIVKFQDISQLENAPARIAVLSSKQKTEAADISLLAQWTSTIVGIEASVETLAKAA